MTLGIALDRQKTIVRDAAARGAEAAAEAACTQLDGIYAALDKARLSPAGDYTGGQLNNACFAIDSIDSLTACEKAANAQVYLLKALLPFISEPIVVNRANDVLRRRGAVN